MRRHLNGGEYGADLYLVALGANMRHPRFGRPRAVLEAALGALERCGIDVLRASPVIDSAPVGPSLRRYANGVAVVRAAMEPPALLAILQSIEQAFGRKRRGSRWRSRVLDLDIVLWGGGAWCSPGLVIPHPHFRERDFVLRPALAVARDWRDPLTGLSLAHLAARLTSPKRAPR
ncbi:2-amino-4-hydroxy-6-hydroxymethyldihydropteridine diphosphokinase [Novosphingobium sp. ZN18A2]|uniref:2-amino-4-hydroxy-6- hydroxymethyldihydropteridine diphosphokinase n=1 Tax=Novosphingobium sp. ZN18A2 TaxID=3079861 RepID=UPI0030D1FFB8